MPAGAYPAPALDCPIEPPLGLPETAMARQQTRKAGCPGNGNRTVLVPRGFPGRMQAPPCGPVLRRFPAGRMFGAVGSISLHAVALLALLNLPAWQDLAHSAKSADQEWVWLPEVALVTPLPEPQPPEPVMEVIPPPVAAPVPETAPEPPPPEPVTAELAPPAPLPPTPEPAPEPVPPAVVADMAPAGEPDAWVEVRTNLIQALRYPARARRRSIEGVAILVLQADGDGRITGAEIRSPAPDPALAAAALAAARGLGPFPALGAAIRAGDVPAAAEIPVRFELSRPGPTAKGPNGREPGRTGALPP